MFHPSYIQGYRDAGERLNGFVTEVQLKKKAQEMLKAPHYFLLNARLNFDTQEEAHWKNYIAGVMRWVNGENGVLKLKRTLV